MISGTYYTITETAAMLMKNRITIRRWIKSGAMEGRRVGNMVLIEEGEVARLVAEQHMDGRRPVRQGTEA